MIKESKHCQLLKDVIGISPYQLKGDRKNEGEILEKEEAKNEESFEEDELISE